MTRPLLAGLALTLTLAGCAAVRDSRLNPLNWFGRPAPAAVVAATPEVAADPRPLVAQVVDVTVDPAPGGAILRATGLPPTQGHWDGELVARPLAEDGVQVYDFRLAPPPGPARVSTPQSRQVVVATFLTDAQLARLSGITVQGSLNALASRR